MSKATFEQKNQIMHQEDEPVISPENSERQELPQFQLQSEVKEQKEIQKENERQQIINKIDEIQQVEIIDNQEIKVELNQQINEPSDSERSESSDSQSQTPDQNQINLQKNIDQNLQVKGFLTRQSLILNQKDVKQNQQILTSELADAQIKKQQKIFSQQSKSNDTLKAILSLIDLIMMIVTSIMAVDCYSNYKNTHCFRDPDDPLTTFVKEKLDKNPLYTTDFLNDIEPALVIALILVIFLKGVTLISR